MGRERPPRSGVSFASTGRSGAGAEDEVMVCQDGADPMAIQVEDEEEETPEADVVSRNEAEQRWKEFIATDNGVESRILTFAVPLVSRKAQHVVEMISLIYSSVRSMHIPIFRLHTDRAREFSGATFAKWCNGSSSPFIILDSKKKTLAITASKTVPTTKTFRVVKNLMKNIHNASEYLLSRPFALANNNHQLFVLLELEGSGWMM